MSSYVGAGAALSWFSSVGGPTGTIGSTGAGARSGGTISQMIVTLSCTQMHVSESCSEVAAFNRSLPLTIFACPVAVSAIHSWMAVSVMFANARCAPSGEKRMFVRFAFGGTFTGVSLPSAIFFSVIA